MYCAQNRERIPEIEMQAMKVGGTEQADVPETRVVGIGEGTKIILLQRRLIPARAHAGPGKPFDNTKHRLLRREEPSWNGPTACRQNAWPARRFVKELPPGRYGIAL